MAPARLTVQAPAKINLLLQSSPGTRVDGYHQLFTVFMAINLVDQVTCQAQMGGRVSVSLTGRGAHLVPRDGTDLTGQAASLLRARLGHPGLGVKLSVRKAIPVSGGMAGGSADAAAALIGCNALWGLGANDHELGGLGAELGADVPFALTGGVACGTNRGDVLWPMPAIGEYHWVLVLAEKGLSTAAVFRQLDAMAPAPDIRPGYPPSLPDTNHPLFTALAAGDKHGVGQLLGNDLEAPACQMRPELADTLAFGRHLDGVLGGVLSGSGPTCVFLCENGDAAAQAASALAGLPQAHDIIVTSGPVPGAAITADSRKAGLNEPTSNH